MAKQIIKQPNGKFAIFSSGTDTFHYTNLTAEEVEEHFVRRAIETTRDEIRDILENVKNDQPGKVYYQFATTWEDAVRMDKESREPEEPFDDHSELY